MRIFAGVPRGGVTNDSGVVEVRIIFIVCYWLYVRKL